MKKLKNIFALVLILLSTACSEDFLNKDVQGYLTKENIYSTPESALRGVNGCYLSLRAPWSVDVPWLTKDVMAGEAYKGGDSKGDQSYIAECGNFTLTPDNQNVVFKWKNVWMGIYKCNALLVGIEPLEMDKNLKERYIGEALFLRAFYYFELVRDFGDLPLITEPISPETNILRSPVSEVYTKIIIPDLIAASNKLPQKSNYKNEDFGRATRGAALSYLTKAYLYQKMFTEAYNTAQLVVEENEYQLESDFRQIFDVENANGIESIFETQCSAVQTYALGSSLSIFTRSRADGGWGFFMPSTYLWNAFETNDPRRALTIIRDKDSLDGKTYRVKLLAPKTMALKYFVPMEKRPANEYERSNYNIKLMRYADLLLMLSEASNEIGKAESAVWALEQVRERARNLSKNPSSVLPKVTTNNRDEFRQAIIHERRVELAMEFSRWYDIVRWGIADEVIADFVSFNKNENTNSDNVYAKDNFFVKGKHELWPIPNKDCSIQGWQNNNGY
jgi:hypothetical protein